MFHKVSIGCKEMPNELETNWRVIELLFLFDTNKIKKGAISFIMFLKGANGCSQIIIQI